LRKWIGGAGEAAIKPARIARLKGPIAFDVEFGKSGCRFPLRTDPTLERTPKAWCRARGASG